MIDLQAFYYRHIIYRARCVETITRDGLIPFRDEYRCPSVTFIGTFKYNVGLGIIGKHLRLIELKGEREPILPRATNRFEAEIHV